MHGDLSIRKVRTGSGATAVQVIRYIKRKCVVVSRIGSAKTEAELQVLLQKAEQVKEELNPQPSLFTKNIQKPILHAEHLSLNLVTYLFAFKFLKAVY